jgi:DNA-binding response OmpR family regulator
VSAKHLYEFGPFRLEPWERRLPRDGQPVALTQKCFDLLVVCLTTKREYALAAKLFQEAVAKGATDRDTIYDTTAPT